MQSRPAPGQCASLGLVPAVCKKSGSRNVAAPPHVGLKRGILVNWGFSHLRDSYSKNSPHWGISSHRLGPVSAGLFLTPHHPAAAPAQRHGLGLTRSRIWSCGKKRAGPMPCSNPRPLRDPCSRPLRSWISGSAFSAPGLSSHDLDRKTKLSVFPLPSPDVLETKPSQAACHHATGARPSKKIHCLLRASRRGRERPCRDSVTGR
jgi:hypothetical protein